MYKCHIVIYMHIRHIKDVNKDEVSFKLNWNVLDISILQSHYLFGLLYLFCGLGSIFHCLFLWGDGGHLGRMKIRWAQTRKSSTFTYEKSVFSIRTISALFSYALSIRFSLHSLYSLSFPCLGLRKSAVSR